jgi:hypothetical protein
MCPYLYTGAGAYVWRGHLLKLRPSLNDLNCVSWLLVAMLSQVTLLGLHQVTLLGLHPAPLLLH